MISDLIDYIEITDVDDMELSQKQLIKISAYLLGNLRDNHDMPGKVWDQFQGICYWYNTHGIITDKQDYWLRIHLKQYISQRRFELDFQ
jgi:hypothetical protein